MRQNNADFFPIELDCGLDVPVYQQIYRAFRDGIVSGALEEGDMLPSVRLQAQGLHVSRGTVERAYRQLLVEGLVEGRQRSGHAVCRLDRQFLSGALGADRTASARWPSGLPHATDPDADPAGLSAELSPARERYDFSFANLDPASFPVREWLRAESDAMCQRRSLLCAYPYREQPGPLQVELAHMLWATRGVHCSPADVVVLPSTEFALDVVMQLFDARRDVVGVEEPGYTELVGVSRRLGFRVRPLASDLGPRRFMADVRASRARVVFVTPSHQFPTGAVMGMETRTELLKWAAERDAFVIEDDSCSELRYDVDPIPSLASLDAQGRVVYLGNFSKTLSPALRVAYAVIPSGLVTRYRERFAGVCTAVSDITQSTLANLIASGEYARHLRRQVSRCRARHELLLQELEDQMGGRLDIQGRRSGLHLYVGVDNGMSEGRLVEAARCRDVRVYRSSTAWFSGRKPTARVMVGFASIAPEDIAPGVRELRRAWFPGGCGR